MTSLRRIATHPLLVAPAIGVTLGACCLMVFAQVRSVHQLKEEAVPTISLLPALTARLTALNEQVELMELQRLLTDGGQDEQIRAYVLPDAANLETLLAQTELLLDQVKTHQAVRDVSPIRIGAMETITLGDGALQVFPVELSLVTTRTGKDELLDLIGLTGVLTVSDALPPEELTMLLGLTEQENPAGIAALEQHFLSVDLLRYVREPKAYEERLLASFPSEAFRDSFTAIRSSSALSDARRLLAGELGDALEAQHLWPMRLLDLRSVSAESTGKDEVRLTLSLRAYARAGL